MHFYVCICYQNNKTPLFLMQKELLLDLLAQNRITCGYTFNQVSAENIHFTLNGQTASVGFIYRHVGETMNMFGYFFGVPSDVQNTTMGRKDEGQGKDVEESRQLIEKGYTLLENLVENTLDASWQDTVKTPFFGTVSRVRLFAHVLYHNAYHAGQIGLT
jgi:uncharacterized damage-inducible protein DinB